MKNTNRTASIKNFEKLSEFERKMLLGLKNCGISPESIMENDLPVAIGAGVSGGADSVSLLVALSEIFKKSCVKIFAVTVNHYIRPDEETCGDVEYVKSLCKILLKQGGNVECIEKPLEKGQIQSYCDENNSSVEEAARKFRYEAFEEEIRNHNMEFMCLAHNQNDQLETAIMRFFQGNSLETLNVIPQTRGKYIRPLLQVTRKEIENYLAEKNISWRTDSTNFDTLYLRNKIRQKLVPFLNSEFEGWQKGVLAGIQKAEDDRRFISAAIENFPMQVTKGQVSFIKNDFIAAEKALQQRLILKACNVLGVSQRISYAFLNDVLLGINNCTDNYSKCSKAFDDIEIICENNLVLVKKSSFLNTDLVFFDIIKTTGIYDFPFGKLEVISSENGTVNLIVNQNLVQKDFVLPLFIRNAQLDDEILAANGKYKKISKIYKDWQISETIKEKIPVVQQLSAQQEILCILGKTLGAEDWIVK